MIPNYSYPWNMYNLQPQQAQQQGMNGNIVWVQGEAGARSIQPNPGQTVLLMDSEQQVFYIKTADSSGMPQPLRTFDYSEKTGITKNVTTAQVPEKQPDYVTREEFEKAIAEIKSNGKSSVSTAKSKSTITE